ncbi:MAG TPA: hypothetical protein VEI49_11740 [Terriglobales bacterium]|nr:hypothetical protein [Terriglobales bacterium]
MRLEFKIVAGLLMLVFAVAPALGALSFGMLVQRAASGCHHSKHRSPAPKSTDYSCCTSGHSGALLQSGYRVEVHCLQSNVMPVVAPTSSESPGRTHLIFPSEDPPGFVPLRI